MPAGPSPPKKKNLNKAARCSDRNDEILLGGGRRGDAEKMKGERGQKQSQATAI